MYTQAGLCWLALSIGCQHDPSGEVLLVKLVNKPGQDTSTPLSHARDHNPKHNICWCANRQHALVYRGQPIANSFITTETILILLSYKLYK